MKMDGDTLRLHTNGIYCNYKHKANLVLIIPRIFPFISLFHLADRSINQP